MMRIQRALAAVGWGLVFSAAAVAAVAVSSASILYMQAGMRGLRQFGHWWWWDYLRVRTPGNSDMMVNSFLCGVGAFGAVVLLGLLASWRLRQAWDQRPLYGETRFATRREMEDAGFSLSRRLRLWR